MQVICNFLKKNRDCDLLRQIKSLIVDNFAETISSLVHLSGLEPELQCVLENVLHELNLNVTIIR